MLNGTLTPMKDAAVGVNDLALLRGYGAFDYFLVGDRRPFFLDDYIDRFLRSAHSLHLELPVGKLEIKTQIIELIEANQASEAAIRLVLTGGYAEDGYTPVSPNLIVLEHPRPQLPPEKYQRGVKLITHAYVREMPSIKTINYVTGIWLLPQLREAGALEPLYHHGGFISETVRSNFFIVDRDDRLITPSDNILMGITRKKVLEIARQYLTVEERPLRLEELTEAKEAFLSSSNKQILPVVKIDNLTIGDGKPGDITKRIMDQFQDLKKAYLKNFLV